MTTGKFSTLWILLLYILSSHMYIHTYVEYIASTLARRLLSYCKKINSLFQGMYTYKMYFGHVLYNMCMYNVCHILCTSRMNGLMDGQGRWKQSIRAHPSPNTSQICKCCSYLVYPDIRRAKRKRDKSHPCSPPTKTLFKFLFKNLARRETKRGRGGIKKVR